MQKQAFSVRFDPLPTLPEDPIYFDTHPIPLPCTQSFPILHYHDRYEIGVCYSGEGLFICEGVFSYLCEGDIIFISPNQKHYSRSLREEKGCECRFVYLNSKEIEDLVRFISKDSKTANGLLCRLGDLIPTVVRRAEYPREHEMLKELIEECRVENINLQQKALLRMALFLFQAKDAFREREALAQKGEYLADTEMIQISEYLSLHYDKNDTASALAKLCHLSESQFRRRFIAVYSVAPITYRNQLRCKIARELLLCTQLPVQKIAMRVGYSDPTDFYRSFRKHYGISPSSYRSRHTCAE